MKNYVKKFTASVAATAATIVTLPSQANADIIPNIDTAPNTITALSIAAEEAPDFTFNATVTGVNNVSGNAPFSLNDELDISFDVNKAIADIIPSSNLALFSNSISNVGIASQAFNFEGDSGSAGRIIVNLTGDTETLLFDIDDVVNASTLLGLDITFERLAENPAANDGLVTNLADLEQRLFAQIADGSLSIGQDTFDLDVKLAEALSVPEPDPLLLLALATAQFAVVRRRRELNPNASNTAMPLSTAER